MQRMGPALSLRSRERGQHAGNRSFRLEIQFLRTLGNTLVISGELVHLCGIDTPDLDQPCLDAERVPYSCGAVARAVLEAVALGRAVDCDLIRFAPGMVPDAICSIQGDSLQVRMVKLGYALDRRDISDGLYFTDETRAASQRMGMWGGAFIAPSQWRRYRQGRVSDVR